MPEDNQTAINHFFVTEHEMLLKIVRRYTLQTGLAAGYDADSIAEEVLNDVVVEVLRHSERFHAANEPTAWVLGVALNLIRRRITRRNTLNQRELLLRDLYSEDTLTDEEVIDQVFTLTRSHDEGDTDDRLSTLLEHLSDDESRLLRLAVLHDLNGEQVAQELGITPGAARVRLHRVLKHLRQFWGSRKRIANL